MMELGDQPEYDEDNDEELYSAGLFGFTLITLSLLWGTGLLSAGTLDLYFIFGLFRVHTEMAGPCCCDTLFCFES